MILEELSLRNWRSYRDPHRFRFSPGVNLLVGANEAGKSTLFEALGRGLFDRHTSRARELRSVRPLGSSLGPEVELTLSVAGHRLRVTKRFLSEVRSEVYEEREGRFELDHEGDRADVAVRRLLSGGEVRGVSRPRHRGIAQALWYLQRDEPLPRGEWDRAVRDGLQGLARAALETSLETGILASLEKNYRLSYTAKGRVAARGALGEVTAEIAELERRLQAMERQLRRLRDLGVELEELHRSETSVEAQLADTVSEGEALESALAEARASGEQKKEVGRLLEAAVSARDRLRATLRDVTRRETQIEKLDLRLEGLEERLDRLRRSTASDKREIAHHNRRLGREIEPGLQELVPEIAELRAVERLDELRRREERIRESLDRRAAEGRRIEDLEARSQAVKAPDEETWQSFERRARQLQLLETRRGAAATRVSFKLHRSDLSVIADPPSEPTESGPVYDLDRPTSFSIGELAEVWIGAGEVGLETEIGELSDRLDVELRRFGCEDREQLAERYRERQRLDGQIAVRRSVLEDLMTRENGAEERLLGVREEIATLEDCFPQPLLPGMEAWTQERRRLRLREMEQKKESLEKILRDQREAQHAAQSRYLERIDEMRKLESERSDQGASRAAHRAELRATLAARDKTTLTLEIETHKGEADGLRSQLAALQRKKVEETIRRGQALEARRLSLDGDLSRLRRQVADRAARRDEIMKAGLHDRIDELEARLEARRQRRQTLERRASAARLLGEMVAAYRESTEEELSRPVEHWMTRWWAQLSGGGYDSVELDATLIPRSAGSSRYEAAMPFSSLSYGSCEQIIVLLRLAIGVSLSTSERQLVVLDDRLVNSDPARMERFCRILEEAGEHCQVFVATCNESLYSSLDANRISVPDDGRREGTEVGAQAPGIHVGS